MQECCIFLNAFSSPDSLTPSGPNATFGFCRGGCLHRPAEFGGNAKSHDWCFYLWSFVGANSVRPGSLTAARDPCGRAMLAPTATAKPPSTPIILAPEGPDGEGRKSVKKRAALLHVLAFSFLDLLFGVLRGEQPLSRASRALGSSGHLFRFLFGCPKRKD